MQNDSLTAPQRPLDFTSASFLIVAFLTGIAGALQTPTLSLFLTEEVHARPAMVGFFFTGSAIIGIFVSQFLAGRSDRKGDRKSLIFVCCLLGALACLLFAWNRNYFILLFVGVFLSSFGSTANPQMFALAREHADRTGREAVMFSSVMRAQLSLAWVIGPPLSFMLALSFGFTTMFLIAAGIFILSLVIIFFALPSVARIEQPADVALTQVSGWKDKNVRMLFIASVLMWTCNTMYIIDMPLWVSQELALPESLAGVLMGTAAGLEIPAMLLAGFYVKRFGKKPMMLVAVGAGVLFYAGLNLFHSREALLGLQLFNALFIGIVAGLGMIWFQDLMPGRAGSATTLFSNSISTGVILAGVVQGALVESFGHYAVYPVIAGIALVALWLTSRVKDV